MRALAVMLALGACHAAAPPPAPAVPTDEAIAILLYDHDGEPRYAVVEDRRWLDVTGPELAIDRVDPAAQLASLTVEPLGAPLAIGACVRDRLPVLPAPALRTPAAPASPSDAFDTGEVPIVAPPPDKPSDKPTGPTYPAVLHCAVRAAPGRYLVRVRYVVPGLGFRAVHDLTITAADHATVRSQYTFATPAWQRAAEIRLFDHVPGSDAAAHEIARRTTQLDGTTAVIATPPRDLPARLRWVYAGAAAVTDDAAETSPREARWHRPSQTAIWLWLELTGAPPLALGVVHARVAIDAAWAHAVDVPAAAIRPLAAGGVRFPLWSDPQLQGDRSRRSHQTRSAMLDQFQISLSNTSGAAREVWFEEDLRPFPRHVVSHSTAQPPAITGDRLRLPITVGAGKLERTRFEIEYELLP
jgi:hypothetical protein